MTVDMSGSCSHNKGNIEQRGRLCTQRHL